MSKLLKNLEQRGLINPPTFLVSNTHCVMGSQADGVVANCYTQLYFYTIL
jgi:hypothetical protein